MEDIDELLKAVEKFMNDYNITITESDKKCLEQMLKELRQIDYNEGYDDDYASGYGRGYDDGVLS